MDAREQVTAIVLGDGQRDAALGSALAARAFAARVLIAERSADTVAQLQERALPADVAVVACDWSQGDAAGTLLTEVDSPWALFLSPGEAPLSNDLAGLAREWSTLMPGPIELMAGAHAETRLHPPTADALAAVGGPGGTRLAHLKLGPLPPSIGLATPLNHEQPFSNLGLGSLAAELPPVLRSTAKLRGALTGEDLDAVERLSGVLAQHEERRLLDMARNGREVCWTDEGEAEPLVTIRIATYHRPDRIGAAIESCLAQTYRRIEVLVVGDHCSEETARVVRGFSDARLRFVNLPARGMYPTEKMARWRVAGVLPANVALMLGEGSWITACDDDDTFTPDHVELLLAHARKHRFEMVHSKADMETEAGRWEVIGRAPLAEGHVTQGSVLYSMGLRFMHLSNTCWRREQPADWNLWSRMHAIGVRCGFLDEITYRHHLETHKRER